MEVLLLLKILRGLIKISKGILINADLNGMYYILIKGFTKAVSVDGIEAFGLMAQVVQQNIVYTIICNKMSIV